ncbi:hypothetical protein CLOP_g6820 [Closterium sp. NIES-67]|nr:hypothetical protein CLOP_g2067 [Closterium sp. NIES-67]GJP76365.1 hypothetical protein CLOP_g6820 [Closterium sp. NIES-67]
MHHSSPVSTTSGIPFASKLVWGTIGTIALVLVTFLATRHTFDAVSSYGLRRLALAGVPRRSLLAAGGASTPTLDIDSPETLSRRRSLAAAGAAKAGGGGSGGGGGVSGSRGKLDPGFVANITAGVKVVIGRVYAIKKSRGKTKITDSCSNDCLSLMSTAEYHLSSVAKALKSKTSSKDVPFWLMAAQDQVTTCLEGFREFSPSTLTTPVGKSLQSHGNRVKKLLSKAIQLSLHL